VGRRKLHENESHKSQEKVSTQSEADGTRKVRGIGLEHLEYRGVLEEEKPQRLRTCRIGAESIGSASEKACEEYQQSGWNPWEGAEREKLH